MRRFAWIIGLLIIALAGGVAISQRSGPPTVEIITPKSENVTRTLAVTGQVEAIASSNLSSPLSGVLVKQVLVDKGTRVKAGQPVILLDDRELRAMRDRAAAAVRQATAGLQRARAQETGAGESVALAQQATDDSTELKNQRDTARTNVRAAQERIKQAEARLSQVKESLMRVKAGARDQAVRASKAQLRRAEAQQRLAKITLDRAAKLLAEGAVAQAEYDTAKTNHDLTTDAVTMAKEEVEQLAEPRTEDVRVAEATVREAEAGVREARVALTGAQTMLRNAERAYTNRIAMRQSLTSVRTEREASQASRVAAEAELMRARADLAQAEAQLTKTVLRAPVNGVVTDRRVEPGETVAPGQTLLSIAGERSLRVRADVDETNLKDIRVGQEALVSPDALPDVKIAGRVQEIVPTANSERGTIEVRIELDSIPERLLPKLTTDVNIITGRYPNALIIPRNAVLDPDDNPRVYVVSEGKAEERSITILSGDVGRVLVLKGLTEREEVVLVPQKVKAGDRVKTKLTKPETKP